MAGLLALGAATAYGQTSVVTHWELQATTTTGTSAWVESFPCAIRGVIVNDPEEMLDYSYNPEATASKPHGRPIPGVFQGGGDDRGGTALWMAQIQAMDCRKD
jgi:hypothetical protein